MMVDRDERFTKLISELGMDQECDSTILKMRVAFLAGSGQSVDASTFKRALDLAAKANASSQTERKPCKCSQGAEAKY